MITETLQAYLPTLLCFLGMGGLLLIQLLVADVVGLKSGHMPGGRVNASHSSFHFRSTRAHANTNESLASFILLAGFAILIGADAWWTNALAIGYFSARVAHMLCYWLNWSIARSSAFVVSLIALFGLFALGVAAVLR